MVSDENLLNLENKQSYLYITSLDKPQIAGVEKVNLEMFKDFTNETTEKEILSKGLTKYDDVTFYEDMGVDSTSRRHILIFNSDLLKDQRKTREKLIDIAIKELEEERKNRYWMRKKAGILSPQNIGSVKYSGNWGFNLSLISNLKVSIYLEKVDHRSAA